jgi:arylsulfatase A-like enzyme
MSWDAYYDQITDWLDDAREGDEPFFLWIFLVDVHMPYLPPKGYRSQSSAAAYASNAWLFGGANGNLPLSGWFHDRLLRAYDDTVHYTDEFVGQLESELADDTVLCVHADHGESFGEDGHYGHGLLYEETIRVPMFVANHPSVRVTRPVSVGSLPDILTTLSGGETIDESYGNPVVTSRNGDGWRVVHGGSWRYTQTPDEEWIENRDGRTLENEDLLEIGRSVTDHEVSSERERQRVITAAASVATSGQV